MTGVSRRPFSASGDSGVAYRLCRYIEFIAAPRMDRGGGIEKGVVVEDFGVEQLGQLESDRSLPRTRQPIQMNDQTHAHHLNGRQYTM